ncbi:hypothetical protein SGFS_033170 [Streptomyces graminofaciens]|uniref:Uncharacterized protein n=1 Tax=Streptomyces graminofaciens TaxID=68212 RepID=A0ABM7F7Y9_9ACTN|nr:hypothetical protein [Streptomyces graminofaciens]BBC32023.1 hypothetical protein SGFS_033170 [Streptomyces graminofaciens]
MSAGRFEDRLLDGLKREIELREAEAEAAGAGSGEGRAKASVRGLSALLTPRRIAVVATACAAAWLAAVAVPGAPADSKAYAVERNGDGSVRLTGKGQDIGVADQRELAKEVRPWGIEVTIDVLAPGYVCDRSEVTSALPAVDEQGNVVPIIPMEARWDVTLRRGNVLAFENTRGDSRPRAVEFYKTKSEAEPCVPRKVTLPDD